MKLIDFKRESWYNVHHEIETCESGRYYTFGDSYMYRFFEIWVTFLNVKIWRIKFLTKNLGKYEI